MNKALITITLIILILLTGCGQAAESPIKIGAIYNLEGAQASLDGPSAKGAKLAVKKINEAGGILGRRLELILYDGKTDTAIIKSAARKLVEIDKVPAIIGFSDTDMVLAAAPIAAGAGVIFITSGATSPKLPEQVKDYLFLACFGDNVQAAAAAEYAYEELDLKTAYLLFDADMEFTVLLGEYFKERFIELGGKITREDTFKGGAKDFSGQMAGLKAQGIPDILYVASGPGDIGNIVKQLRKANIAAPIFGGDSYDTPLLVETAGEYADNIYFTTHCLIDAASGTALMKEFIADYRAEYGVLPENAFAALGYDSVMFLADAIKRAKSDNPKLILTALQSTRNLPGVTGDISFENGARIPKKSVAIISVEKGLLTLAKMLVPRQVPGP